MAMEEVGIKIDVDKSGIDIAKATQVELSKLEKAINKLTEVINKVAPALDKLSKRREAEIKILKTTNNIYTTINKTYEKEIIILKKVIHQQQKQIDSLKRQETQAKSTGNAMKFLGGVLVAAFSLQFIQSALGRVDAFIARLDNLVKLAQQLDLPTDLISGLDFAGEVTGANITEIRTSIERFTRAAGDAAEGSEEYAKRFRGLGVAVKDVNGNIKSTEQILYDTADALAAADRNVLSGKDALEIFGRSALKMMPLFKDGAEGLKGYIAQAAFFGVVLKKETVPQVEAIRDAFFRLNASLAGVRIQITERVLSSITEYVQTLAITIATHRDEIVDFFILMQNTVIETIKGFTSISGSVIKNTIKLIDEIGYAAGSASLVLGELFNPSQGPSQAFSNAAKELKSTLNTFKNDSGSILRPLLQAWQSFQATVVGFLMWPYRYIAELAIALYTHFASAIDKLVIKAVEFEIAIQKAINFGGVNDSMVNGLESLLVEMRKQAQKNADAIIKDPLVHAMGKANEAITANWSDFLNHLTELMDAWQYNSSKPMAEFIPDISLATAFAPKDVSSTFASVNEFFIKVNKTFWEVMEEGSQNFLDRNFARASKAIGNPLQDEYDRFKLEQERLQSQQAEAYMEAELVQIGDKQYHNMERRIKASREYNYWQEMAIQDQETYYKISLELADNEEERLAASNRLNQLQRDRTLLLVREKNTIEEMMRNEEERYKAYRENSTASYANKSISNLGSTKLGQPGANATASIFQYANDQNGINEQLQKEQEFIDAMQELRRRGDEVDQERYAQHLKNIEDLQRQSKFARLQLAADLFGGLADTMTTYMQVTGNQSKELAIAAKAAAIAQATISTFVAANNVFAAISSAAYLGPAALPLAIAGASVATATGLANVAMIAATPMEYHTGGLISNGRTSGEVDIRAQQGEYMFNRGAVAFLDRLNRMDEGDAYEASRGNKGNTQQIQTTVVLSDSELARAIEYSPVVTTAVRRANSTRRG